jgi:hypothetical protein
MRTVDPDLMGGGEEGEREREILEVSSKRSNKSDYRSC